ncbi:MAG: macrolide ABC transporter ATP-binding protein [gamma proteobacterium symbiont of Ctena orbiculata]|uniref:ABC transporter ATP-binding protein n=1 Tax=Candidatus Thiodiazotropha taylori TaxID=2792791 RepID=A0A944M5G6_9GAMM|nr:ABC transporter ATP-binding protein [Candidatus Thiodiazotropha taylori]PUB90170.1 MAG: macrolide ABC transporter ATP-binding protein [gamma proteobacterium symbiont of Ctena orbiculata]MBT2988361.1 ABC transporter ATP-binding protein [Candidatus Thiodiazotropha taylori]MBT2997268.1 ABC transporter ATP-binding protein [Candidatus Thiodiazotropha taylori]MBT3001022.1 ABC transporter ATP-binding protein [Candidatus Thiodiazotropha taylori]
MIEIEGLSKSYWRAGVELAVIRDVALRVDRGEFVAIMGPSGSGKSTLLNIIGCLDVADRGHYSLSGEVVDHAIPHRLARFRASYIGFIFQSFNLIPTRTALENVALPLLYQGIPGTARQQRALSALEHVGMADRASHLPNQLSGGQQQRVAIARALVNRPSLLIADEPTGALDSRNSAQVMSLFRSLHAEGHTLLMVTHDPVIGEAADRIVSLRDGEILS